MITDEINKEDAITRMEKDYAGFDVLNLLEEGVISILSTGQWYFINDSFDGDRTQFKWQKAVEESLLNNFLIENSSKKGKASGLGHLATPNPSLTKIDHYVMIIRIPLVLLINLSNMNALWKSVFHFH